MAGADYIKHYSDEEIREIFGLDEDDIDDEDAPDANDIDDDDEGEAPVSNKPKPAGAKQPASKPAAGKKRDEGAEEFDDLVDED